MTAGEKLSPDSLASAHRCRLGRWYEDVSDTTAIALPSFKAMKAPHESVHECGRRALMALGANDAAAAQRCVTDMRAQSEQVMRHLDDFAREYPTTFGVTNAAA